MLAIALGWAWSPAAAQTSYFSREYPIKAAYLYNFAKYVQWPEAKHQPASHMGDEFVIGVLGDSPITPHLQTLATQKTLQGRNLRIAAFDEAEEVAGCHILFVPEQRADDLDQLRACLAGSPILIVGETSGFASEGGMIHFMTLDNRVRFAINPQAAQEAGLKISSRLLAVGQVVSE